MVAKHGKKYNEVKKFVDKTKKYEIKEGVELVKKVSYVKFVPSVEIHICTNAEPKYNDQMMRGTLVLPHGTGKIKRVAAFVSDDKLEEAKTLGADVVGNNDLIKAVENGNIDFDVLITTQDMMRDLAKVAKILGPKGLMPSPKAGTVTNNLKETIDEIKKGRIEYKMDKTGNFHLSVGKMNFDNEQIEENIQYLLRTLEDNKPSGVKGRLIKKVTITPTMGPGIQIQF